MKMSKSLVVRFCHWFVGKVDVSFFVICFVCRHIDNDELVVFFYLLHIPLIFRSLVSTSNQAIDEDYIWCSTNGDGVHLHRCLAFRLLLENGVLSCSLRMGCCAIVDVNEETGLLERLTKQTGASSEKILLIEKVYARLSALYENSSTYFLFDFAKEIVDYQRHTIGELAVGYLKKQKLSPKIVEDFFSNNQVLLKSLSEIAWKTQNSEVNCFINSNSELKFTANYDVCILRNDVAFDYNTGPSAFYTFCKQKLNWSCMAYKGPEMKTVESKCYASESLFINSPQIVCTSLDQFQRTKTNADVYAGLGTLDSNRLLAKTFTRDCSSYISTYNSQNVQVENVNFRTVKDTLQDVCENTTGGGYFFLRYKKRTLENVKLYKYDFVNFLPQILLKVIPHSGTGFLPLFFQQMLANIDNFSSQTSARKSIKWTINTMCGYLKWTHPELFKRMNSEARNFMLNVVDFIERQYPCQVIFIAYDGFLIQSFDDGKKGFRLPNHFDNIQLRFEGFFTHGVFKGVNQTILINTQKQTLSGLHCVDIRGVGKNELYPKIVKDLSKKILYNFCADRFKFPQTPIAEPWTEKTHPRCDYIFIPNNPKVLLTSWLIHGQVFSIRSCYEKQFVFASTLNEKTQRHKRTISSLKSVHFNDKYEEEVANHITYHNQSEKKALNYPQYVLMISQQVAPFKYFFNVSFSETFSKLLKSSARAYAKENRALYRLSSHPLESDDITNEREALIAAFKKRAGHEEKKVDVI